MSDPLLSSWKFYRDAYPTITVCINAKFPNTLGKDPAIRAALVAIENAERAIEARIAELDE